MRTESFQTPGETRLDIRLGAGEIRVETEEVQETTVVLVISLGGLLLVGALLATRLRSPVEAAFLPLVVLIACLSPAATTNPRDLLRVTSVLVVLFPFVILSTGLGTLSRGGTGSAFAGHEGRRSP